MALTLSSTLTAHQRGTRKRPALAARVSSTRFGIPVFPLVESIPDTSEPSAPVAVGVDASGNFVIVRNNAGDLDYSVDGTSWTNIDTVTAGQGLALAYDPIANAILLAYGDGNDLKLRTTADGFVTPTTIVTEASPIGAVALAVRASSGNACAFYAIGTTTTVKRLRRTSGTWAGSGTTWSRTADVATITGLAAAHNGDYFLAVTGTEVTTTHEKLWAVAMGDGGIPSNAWSGLITIAEADAAAACTFAYPAITNADGVFFVTFQQAEAGDVAASRVMLTSTTATGGPLAHWREPYPLLPAGIPTSHGAAIAYIEAGSDAGFFVASPATLHIGFLAGPKSLTDRILSASWRETPTSCKLRLELDDHDGAALDNSGGVVGPQPGMDLSITYGFASGSGGSTENGVVLRLPIVRVIRRFKPGAATVTIEADGPWEHLARYRAPQAWTAPSGYTRGQVFGRLAGRAGIEVQEAGGDRAPSTSWSTDTPAFAVAAGEHGDTSLRRLLEPTPDFLRIAGTSGAFQVCGSFLTSEDPAVDENYRMPAGPLDHPLQTLSLVYETETDWVRLQGPDRYADAFYDANGRVAAGLDGYLAGAGTIMDHVRDLAATTDALANAAAAGALLRRQLLTPRAELTAPAHLGQELYDPVRSVVSPNGAYELDGDLLRVIARGIDYKAGKAGPEYTTTLTLGRL